MDIYKYAEDLNYAADYMDMSTGYIYLIKQYGECIKNGLPTQGIEVVDQDGKLIGYAKRR